MDNPFTKFELSVSFHSLFDLSDFYRVGSGTFARERQTYQKTPRSPKITKMSAMSWEVKIYDYEYDDDNRVWKYGQTYRKEFACVL